MSAKKTVYLVIEGIDGAGKETQTRLLKEYLTSIGKKVITQSFPNYESDSSKPVKMYLDGKLSPNASDIDAYQSSALFAIDRFCTMKELQKQIDSDTVVVFDRYVSSNMLHQGGKIKDEKELEKYLKWLEDFEFNLMKVPKPDKIFFLAVTPEMSKKLFEKRGVAEKDVHKTDPEHLKNAYNTGMKICKMFNWEIINCEDEGKGELRTREDISKEIQDKVNAVLNIK